MASRKPLCPSEKCIYTIGQLVGNVGDVERASSLARRQPHHRPAPRRQANRNSLASSISLRQHAWQFVVSSRREQSHGLTTSATAESAAVLSSRCAASITPASRRQQSRRQQFRHRQHLAASSLAVLHSHEIDVRTVVMLCSLLLLLAVSSQPPISLSAGSIAHRP